MFRTCPPFFCPASKATQVAGESICNVICWLLLSHITTYLKSLQTIRTELHLRASDTQQDFLPIAPHMYLVGFGVSCWPTGRGPQHLNCTMPTRPGLAVVVPPDVRKHAGREIRALSRCSHRHNTRSRRFSGLSKRGEQSSHGEQTTMRGWVGLCHHELHRKQFLSNRWRPGCGVAALDSPHEYMKQPSSLHWLAKRKLSVPHR